MNKLSSLSPATILFCALAIIYTLLSFILPINSVSQQSLGVTSQQYTVLLLLIRLPIMIVWLIAYYAYWQMHRYSKVIAETSEGKHFRTITLGLGFIVWGLLISSLLTGILNSLFTSNSSWHSSVIIIVNYSYVLTGLVGFSLISSGAHRLARAAKTIFTTSQLRIIMLLFTFLGVGFCYLIARRLHGTDAEDSYNSYFLPNALIWLTIVVPYLYAWFLGIFAALELLLVAKNTRGILYRRALQYLAFGFVALILALFIMQYYRALTPRTGRVTIGSALLVSYITYLFIATGSLIVARGARRMRRIEEV